MNAEGRSMQLFCASEFFFIPPGIGPVKFRRANKNLDTTEAADIESVASYRASEGVFLTHCLFGPPQGRRFRASSVLCAFP